MDQKYFVFNCTNTLSIPTYHSFLRFCLTEWIWKHKSCMNAETQDWYALVRSVLSLIAGSKLCLQHDKPSIKVKECWLWMVRLVVNHIFFSEMVSFWLWCHETSLKKQTERNTQLVLTAKRRDCKCKTSRGYKKKIIQLVLHWKT